MSDLFGNHIVGFPTRRLMYLAHDKGTYGQPSRFGSDNLPVTTRPTFLPGNAMNVADRMHIFKNS